jgi:fructose-1,6-bisphosphatase
MKDQYSEKEYLQLLSKCFDLAEKIGKLERQIAILTEKLEVAKATLKFYSSPANYNRDFGDNSEIENDLGNKSSTALEKIKELNSNEQSEQERNDYENR